MTAATEPENVPPELVIVLYSDPRDAVTAAVMHNAHRFACPVLAIGFTELIDSLVVNPCWSWHGRSIDPLRTAVINRLTSFDTGAIEPQLPPGFSQQRFWSSLHAELQAFAYVSSMPTAASPLGGYGSLLDQWLDLPEQVPGLRVPAHQTPWTRGPLTGDVCAVNPWNLYSLGQRVSAGGPVPGAGQLVYARPAGVLVHVAQVGGAVLFGSAPPHMTPRQHASIVAFTNAMRRVSRARILEHAFFVGSGEPVFYSTCPVPVITGSLPQYAQLVVQGLQDDFARHRPARHAAA